MATYIEDYISTASSGNLILNISTLVNGTKPITGNDNHDNNALAWMSVAFTESVLDTVDRLYNLADYDNDGPDGSPNSGDDDGYVDYVFLINLWPGDRGTTGLYLDSDYVTNDLSAKTGFGNIRISRGGNAATRQVIYRTISPIVLHEYGHSIGHVPDIDHNISTYFNHYSVGSFDVMAKVWGFDSIPSVYNPFFRDEYFSWLSPDVVTGNLTDENLTDLLTTGKVLKYVLPNKTNARLNEKFYITYHQGLSQWDQNWPTDPTYGGVLIWRAINNGYTTNNDITNSICYPQVIDIEAAHGKWKWTEYTDSVHNTGVQDPLTGFDSLEIRKMLSGSEIQGPYYQKDAGSSSIFFTPNSGKDFAFYTNPNSNLIYNTTAEKYARNIISGFAVKNISYSGGTVTADVIIDDYNISSSITLPKGKWYSDQDLTINAGASLTFQAGSELIFRDGSSLIVNGTLNAFGTSTDSIKFDFVSPNNNGIVLNSSANATIKYVLIKNANRGITVSSCEPLIEHCEIKNCADGIYMYNSNFQPDMLTGTQVLHSNIHNNIITGIYLNDASPLISDCDLIDNDVGMRSFTDASPFFGYLGEPGMNAISGNGLGVYAYLSTPVIGIEDVGGYFVGGYNNFTNNTYNHIFAEFNTSVTYAENCYWDDTTKIWWDEEPVDYHPRLYNPVNTAPLTIQLPTLAASKSSANFNPKGDEKLKKALLAYFSNDIKEAKNICKEIISENENSSLSFAALNLLRKINNIASEKVDIESFIGQIAERRDQNFLTAIAQITLADMNKDNYTYKMDLVISGFSNLKIHELAYYKKFLYSYHELRNIELAASIVDEMNIRLPNAVLTKEANYLLYGNNHEGKKERTLANKTEEGLVTNYPNPFNPSTTIAYTLKEKSNVNLTVYDILGRELQVLVNTTQEAGEYTIHFDGSNYVSGIYLYRLKVNGKTFVKKMLMTK